MLDHTCIPIEHLAIVRETLLEGLAEAAANVAHHAAGGTAAVIDTRAWGRRVAALAATLDVIGWADAVASEASGALVR